jgi:hypothetical protein
MGQRVRENEDRRKRRVRSPERMWVFKQEARRAFVRARSETVARHDGSIASERLADVAFACPLGLGKE